MQRNVSFAIAVGVFVLSGPLSASGFSVFEQGAEASARAGAWVAQADDAAANWYNPAALVWLKKDEIQFGSNFITAGSSTDFTLDPGITIEHVEGPIGAPVLLDGFQSSRTIDAESTIATPVHFYYADKVNDHVAWGLGLNTPFGLVTEWDEGPLSFVARKSELATFVLNPNVAVRLNESWSVAFGLDYIYADLKSFSRDINTYIPVFTETGLQLSPLTVGQSNLTGDGTDLGFNVALSHHREDGWSLGATYRSELEPEIDGELTFSGDVPLPGSPGSADLRLPAQAALAFGWEGGPFSWELDVAWAGWSSFDSIDVDLDDEIPGVLEDFSIREDWEDTFSYRLGFGYHPGSKSEWRAGLVYDESPVPVETMRPSIPDADRTGLTMGYGYTSESWKIDAYYMALDFDDVTTVPGEAGVIGGTYSSFVHLAGLTVSRRF